MRFNRSISYPPQAEQTPKLWWDSVSQLLKELPQEVKDNLLGLAIDGTSGSILLTDKSGNPSSSALMYNDLRATEEAQLIKTILPHDNGGQGASGSLARLLWLLKNEPNEKHAHAVHQADYILGKLANNFRLSDENNCLKLGYDAKKQCWPEDEIIKLRINPSLLPKVYPAGTYVEPINNKQADLLGLPQSLKLMTGTTDSVAAFIATGADNIGDAVTSLGSTLVLKLVSDKPIFSAEHGIYSHRLKDKWLVGGASNSGAKVLLHYFTQAEIDEMTLRLSPKQATNLGYYPLIQAGERFPVADVSKQPKLFPRPASDVEFFQGILEGIADIEMQAYQVLVKLGAPVVSSVRSVGGGSYNDAWTQIRQSNLKVDMITPEQTEAAYGSALLALQGYIKND